MRTVVKRSFKRWTALAALGLAVYGSGWGMGQYLRHRQEVALEAPRIIRAPAELRPFAEE
jgi:hypothetical protein